MKPTVVVAGEALVDLVPNAGGTLSALLGGGPFNTARALGRLGQNTVFAGCVSTDRLGRSIAGALKADGVHLDLRLRTDQPTSLALAELDEAGAATYGFYLTGTSALELTPERALAILPDSVSALHVGSLGLLLEPMAAASEALIRAMSSRAPVMLDPNVPGGDPRHGRVPVTAAPASRLDGHPEGFRCRSGAVVTGTARSGRRPGDDGSRSKDRPTHPGRCRGCCDTSFRLDPGGCFACHGG